jgi:hypothetical protein
MLSSKESKKVFDTQALGTLEPALRRDVHFLIDGPLNARRRAGYGCYSIILFIKMSFAGPMPKIKRFENSRFLSCGYHGERGPLVLMLGICNDRVTVIGEEEPRGARARDRQ